MRCFLCRVRHGLCLEHVTVTQLANECDRQIGRVEGVQVQSATGKCQNIVYVHIQLYYLTLGLYTICHSVVCGVMCVPPFCSVFFNLVEAARRKAERKAGRLRKKTKS